MFGLLLDLAMFGLNEINYHEYKTTGHCDPHFEKGFKQRKAMRHNYQPGEVQYPAITSQFMRR